MVIATTNYPELLEPNIVDRPSRFDHLVYVNTPSAVERREYLVAQLGSGNYLEEGELDYILEETKDASIAYLKELVVLTRVYGEPIRSITKKFKERKRLIEKDFNHRKRSGAGFDEEN